MSNPVFAASRRPRSLATRPRKAFFEPAVRLADFYDEVGRAAFDIDWVTGTRPANPSTKRTALAPSDERAALVADDLTFALQAGTVQAALLLSLPEPVAVSDARSVSPSGNASTSADECDPYDLLGDDLIDGDQPVTATNEPPGRHHLTQYLIDANFWDSNWREDIDWRQSQLHVPVRFIRATSSSHSASQRSSLHPLITYRPDLRYGSDQRLLGPVVVLRADRTLSAMFALGDLPSAEVNARYLSFRNRLIDEVVAAAWRWLAINCRANQEVKTGECRANQKVKTGELVAAIALYLERQGIDGEAHKLGEKGLEAVARQVLAEREGKSTSSMVLKNTRTAKPFRAAPDP